MVPSLEEWETLDTNAKHGTTVAAMAVGTIVGVAKNASLVGVKMTSPLLFRFKSEGIEEALRFIIDDVQRKEKVGKAVVNMNWGKRSSLLKSIALIIYVGAKWLNTLDCNAHADYGPRNLHSSDGDIFLPLFRDMWKLHIVTVISAANSDPYSRVSGYWTPQRFANPRNAIISVASVDRNGMEWSGSAPLAPQPVDQGGDRNDYSLTGEHSIFALGVDVDIIIYTTQSSHTTGTGNSYAAPQVAGLAAYLLALPFFSSNLRGNLGVSMEMKKLLISLKDARFGKKVAWNAVWWHCTTLPRRDVKNIRHHITNLFRRKTTNTPKIQTEIILKNGYLLDEKVRKNVSICPCPKRCCSSRFLADILHTVRLLDIDKTTPQVQN